MVEALDDLDDAQGNPIGSQSAPQIISVDAVEGLLEVNKIDIQQPLPFSALFNDVAQCEDLSVHPCSFLKPACSFLMPASTAPEIRLMMTLVIILLGANGSVTPRHLLQSL